MIAKNKQFKLTLSSFDVIKGICMITVIIGHMSYNYNIENLALPIRLLYGYVPLAGGMMPMFFMIGGYGFKEKPAKKLLQQTFDQLIKPYLIVMGIFVVIYPIIHYFWYHDWSYGLYETGLYLIAFLLGIPKSGKVLFGYTICHCSAVWFFLACFIAANTMNLILKTKKTAMQSILVVLCLIVGYEMIIRDINFYCIPQGLMAVGFYYIGYIMKKHRLLVRGIKSIWSYVVLLPIALLFTIQGHFDLCQGEFNNGLLDYFGVCGVAVLLMYAGVYIGQVKWKPIDWLGNVGMYTYWIICIHVIEDTCMHWWAFADAVPNHNVAFVGELILKAIIITSGCFILKRFTQLRYRRRRIANGQ